MEVIRPNNKTTIIQAECKKPCLDKILLRIQFNQPKISPQSKTHPVGTTNEQPPTQASFNKIDTH
jgi:hypothetical protein